MWMMQSYFVFWSQLAGRTFGTVKLAQYCETTESSYAIDTPLK
jgi:hypothetical protein